MENTAPVADATSNVSETPTTNYKVVVDGVESEVSIDDLLKGYGSNKAAQDRFSEAARTKQEAQQVLQMLKENPREVMKQLGMNPREVAEAMLTFELDELTMDPKDRELRDLKKHFQSQKEQEDAAKKEQEETETNRQVYETLQNITSEMVEVLQEHGFEPSPYSAERFRYYMQSALNAGHIVTPKQCAKYVIADIQSEIRAMTNGKDVVKLKEIFGDELVRKIARSSIDQDRGFQKPVARILNDSRPKANKKQVKLTPRDVFGGR